MTIPRSGSAVFDWIARSRQEPQQAHRDWLERGTTQLPLGTRFNAVRLSAQIVHAAVGTTDPDVVGATLAELLCGPVIHDRPKATYYALIERCPAARWSHPDEAPMLGSGHRLSVPASDLCGPTGLYWAVRPRMVGDLCLVQSVAALVHIARDSLRGSAR
ncbi:hypothetical protein [Streptomyces silaceus]|uniref:hypothetical protein n=1 Tax=Streptomyces silaceus TaxID=545123 RepID=UPI0006EBC59E|nr:hypothetical protein [Streptomyces silaceus]